MATKPVSYENFSKHFEKSRHQKKQNDILICFFSSIFTVRWHFDLEIHNIFKIVVSRNQTGKNRIKTNDFDFSTSFRVIFIFVKTEKKEKPVSNC